MVSGVLCRHSCNGCNSWILFEKAKNFFKKNAFWEDFVNIGRGGIDTLIPAHSGKGLETCDENSTHKNDETF